MRSEAAGKTTEKDATGARAPLSRSWPDVLGGPIAGGALPHSRLKLATPEEQTALFRYLLGSSVLFTALVFAALAWPLDAPTQPAPRVQGVASISAQDSNSIAQGAGMGSPAAVGSLGLVHLNVLVILVGCLGGSLHGLASLSHHASKGQFIINWRPFYISRPYIGGIVALFFLFIVRAGMGGAALKDPASIYTTLACSALAGLFSFRLLEKFRDLLDALFPVRAEPVKDAGTNPQKGSPVPPSPGEGDPKGRAPRAELPAAPPPVK
jgi:hypothetical protein